MLFISLRHLAPLFFSLIISCLILAGYSEALASFRFGGGSYSMGYRTHKETEDGKLLGEADSLSQRLSLSVVNRGNLYGMSSSPYSLLLGYTHQRYSTDIDDSSYSPSANDLSWAGDISIVQTRRRGLSLYAMSNKREDSRFSTSAAGSRISVDFPAQAEKQIYSEHGISIIKGDEKTLKSFLSYYTSSRGYTNEKDERDFSHLSLQRGINWLHLDLEERRVSLQGSTERRSVSVGNVSHRAGQRYVPSSSKRGTREWFRLTNWFEISTDLNYTATKSGESDENSSYRVSFFGKGYRKIWSMFLSPNYSASENTASTERSLRLPVSVYYFPARKFELSSSTGYSKNESINNLGITLSESESMSENLSAIIEPRAWLTVRPAYYIARNDSNGLSSLSQNAALDLTAKGANINTSLQSSYGTSKSETIGGIDSKSDNFRVKAGVAYRRFAWVRNMAFSHEYAVASNNAGDRTELNTSEFRFSVVPSYRSSADFSALRSESDVNGQASESTEVDATLRYDTKKRFSNEMLIYMREGKTEDSDTKLTRLKDQATYSFTKNLKSKTIIDSTKDSSQSGDSSQLSFSQSIYYSHYGGGFLGRKIYDLSGNYSFDKSDSSGAQDRKSSEYFAAINYYLSRVITIGGSYSYRSNNVSDIRTATKLYANMRYAKLTAGISYRSDVNENSGAGEKVVERIDFSLTKYF